MPHITGHGSGIMSNPYKEAAQSMQSVGISSLSGTTTSDKKGTQAKQKQIESGFTPVQNSGGNNPVGATGNGQWNGGYDDDKEEEKKHWDSIQNDKNRNRILNEVVSNYNKEWLGANSEWGNFEDDTKVTKAIKFGSNFLMRALYMPAEITYAKFVADPVANTVDALQEAGYVSPPGTTWYPYGDNKNYEPRTVKTGMEYGYEAKTAAEIGTAIYSAPALFRSLKKAYDKLPFNFSTTATNKSKNLKVKNGVIIRDANEEYIDIEGYSPVNILNKDGSLKHVAYYPKIDSPLDQSSGGLLKGTDDSGLLIKNHLDKKHQTNQSYVEGLARISQWRDLPYQEGTGTILNNLVFKNYTAKNSQMKKVLDDAGVTPQNNPDAFQTIIVNGEYHDIPKVVYHATSAAFDKGLKSNAKAIHSADGKTFIGVTDNIDDSLGYAFQQEVGVTPNVPQQYQVQPRIYISIPKVNNTFNPSSNLNHLDEAATYIGTQRFNHVQGIKKLDWDEFDVVENAWYGAGHSTNKTGIHYKTVDDHISDIKRQLENPNTSNWAMLENEMRLFDDVTGKPTQVLLKNGKIVNHKLELDGYDSFVTKEFAKDKSEYVTVNQTNIMVFDADKNLIPVTQYIDEIPKIEKSPVSGMVYGTEGQPFSSIGQWMAPVNTMGTDALGFKLGSDKNILFELLGDATDTINQPSTPFDNDNIELDDFAKFA